MISHEALLCRKGRSRRAAKHIVPSAGGLPQRHLELQQSIAQKIDAASPECVGENAPVHGPLTGPDSNAQRASSPPPFSVRSLAERWSCSESVIRTLIRNGTLSHFRVGDLIRIPSEDVRRFECRK